MPYNIHCEKCGHEFQVEKWHPGLPCVKCQAADTVPMTRIDAPGTVPKPPLANDKRAAAAPNWKNNPVVAGIAIVVIVAIWLGLGVWKFKKPEALKVEIWAACTECSEKIKTFTRNVPADCLKCGKRKTVHTLYECQGDESKECGNVFVFVSPPAPADTDRDSADWDKMSEEERNEEMMKVDMRMMEHEEIQMEASKCPKCGSHNTGPVYSEEQKKKFEEMRKKYATKKRKRKKR